MIEMPLTLKLRAAPLAAEAFFLPTIEAAEVVHACRQLGSSNWTAIYRVADGYLLIPDGPIAGEVFGAIRLRRLGGDLFLPAQADLIPDLLPDEIVALSRTQGLLVLPDGVRAFDRKAFLKPKDILAAPSVSRRNWSSFPEREVRAERLTLLERPRDTPAAVLESLKQGQPDGAEPLAGPGETASIPESARPQSGSLGQRVAAGATLAAAQFMAFASWVFKNPKLGELAGRLARSAVERVPRITEKLLGTQEAALRNILKQLQSGDIEKALRQAPIAVSDPDAPSVVGTNARLNTMDPRYNLASLLGRGSGPAVAWLGGGDVWFQLAQEYRRLAEEALRRGDVRRAAYLYGVLLRDLRSAANALTSGGLHRDAAMILRDKLNDLPAAARQFEHAGDIDEAVRLYDRIGQHENAAELLRRAGDDERAAVYFRRAAEQHAGNRRWVAAGDLVRNKLGDRAAAREYYRRGWTTLDETAACGERLFDEYVVAAEWPEVTELLFEASTDILIPPRSTEAGRFFNTVLKNCEMLPEPLAENLADTARCLFAEHLRTSTKSPHLAGQLFGGESVWPAEVVRDAIYAARGVEKTPGRATHQHEPITRVADGDVVAAIVARESRDLIIATTRCVVCWRNATGHVVPILPLAPARGIRGLATDHEAKTVYVLYAEGNDLRLRCFREDKVSFQSLGQLDFPGVAEEPGLRLNSDVTMSPVGDGIPICMLLTPEGFRSFSGHFLSSESGIRPAVGVRQVMAEKNSKRMWLWDDTGIDRVYADGHGVNYALIKVSSAFPQDHHVPRLDWRSSNEALDLAAIDRDGILHAIRAEFDEKSASVDLTNFASTGDGDQPFEAVSFIPGGGIIVAAGREIRRYRSGYNTLTLTGSTRLGNRNYVSYLFAQSSTDAVAVLSDASVVRVRIP